MPINQRGKRMSNVVVYTGPMFSRKTTRLVERIAEVNSPGGLVFKHASDEKRLKGWLSSHDPKVTGRIEAMPIQSLYQVLEYVEPKTTHVFIDEVQWFKPDEARKFLESMDKNYPAVQVVVAGLNLDYRGQPFEATVAFIKAASEVVACTGACGCGQTATMSYFKLHASCLPGVGGMESYEPRCEHCHAAGMAGGVGS
jgi:thymidine kinase